MSNQCLFIHFLSGTRTSATSGKMEAIFFMHLDHIKNFSRVRICQLHFQETDYKDGGAVRKRRELKEGIEPTVFSGVPKILQKTVSLLRNTKRAASSMRQKQL